MTLDRIAFPASDRGKSAPASAVSRRSFLQVGAAAGGGLLLSVSLPFARDQAEAVGTFGFAPNAFIRIGSDGQIVLIMPYVEMGQGTYTSIPMLIAEELEVDLDQVRVEHAPPNEKLYANPLIGIQATGGSTAIRAAWKPMREAGATATNDAGRGGGEALECRSGNLSGAKRRSHPHADRAKAHLWRTRH